MTPERKTQLLKEIRKSITSLREKDKAKEKEQKRDNKDTEQTVGVVQTDNQS